DAALDALETGVLQPLEIILGGTRDDQRLVESGIKGRRRGGGLSLAETGNQLQSQTGGKQSGGSQKPTTCEIVLHRFWNTEPKSDFDNAGARVCNQLVRDKVAQKCH